MEKMQQLTVVAESFTKENTCILVVMVRITVMVLEINDKLVQNNFFYLKLNSFLDEQDCRMQPYSPERFTV